MSMRLLPKREVDQAKAADRKREVDEGVKLAGRVDALRETVASEEANLTKFRTKNVSLIMNEIKELEGKKATLVDEVNELESAKKAAEIPLDKEWEQVKQEKSRLEKLDDKLADRAEALQNNKYILMKTEEQLKIEEGRIEDLKHRASEDLVLADRLKNEASEVLAKSRNDAHVKGLELEVREKEIEDREQNVAHREVDAQNKFEAGQRAQANADIERRRLQDLYATLERTKKHLHG